MSIQELITISNLWKNIFFIIRKYSSPSGPKKFNKINNIKLEETILPEISIQFFINSTPTQILTSKLTLIQTQTLIFTLKKANKKARMNISHFLFIRFDLKIFGEIVTT